MALLRTKRPERILKNLRFYATDQVAAYITLYALAKGVTRSSLLRDITEDWYTNHRTNSTEDELINKIVDKAEGQWVITRDQFEDFDAFLEELEAELEVKKIDNTSCRLIIRRLDEKNKENNPNE